MENSTIIQGKVDENIKKALYSCTADVSSADWTINGDIFNREQYADQLTQLIRNTNCPYVIALSSAWGTGKSYFLHAWKKKIDWNTEGDNSDKIPCVYFSAWESEEDFDPALAVLGSVRKALLDKNLLEDNTLKKVTKSVTQFLTSPTKLMKAGLTITKGIANTLTQNAIDDVGIQVLEDFVKDPLEAYAKQKENDIDLKFLLEQLVAEVHTQTNTPVLVMIDELDRCKPDYVIKLLERIKHFFSIPNLVFVLAIDKGQLLAIVEHTFGLKAEYCEIYLEKFIDLFYELPKPSIMQYAKHLIINNLQDEFEEIEKSSGDLSAVLVENKRYSTIYRNMKDSHKVYQYIVELYHKEDDSLRDFEKKFYKFLTIRSAYLLDYKFSVLLFLRIISNTDKFISDTNKKIYNQSLKIENPNSPARFFTIEYTLYMIIVYQLIRNLIDGMNSKAYVIYNTTESEVLNLVNSVSEYTYEADSKSNSIQSEVEERINQLLSFTGNIKFNL